MASILSSIGELWRRTGLVQRVVLLVMGVVCLGAVALLMNWASKPNMVLLYGGLSAEEAGTIAEKVRDEGIRCEMKDGGASVFVPEQNVYALRASLASEGLPSGEQPGYKILDDDSIGASPSSQRINHTRAVEGEIAKSIRMIDGVISARVHVVRPESNLFSGRDRKASATVAMKIKPGWRLTRRNIAAIVHLVAGSVENLSPGDVVVVDSAGNLLSGEGQDDLAKGTAHTLDYKAQVEQYVADKAEDMLAAVLGPGRASVRVSATIEMTGSSARMEKLDPAKFVKREMLKEKSTTPAGVKTTGASKDKDNTTETEYVYSKTIEEKTLLPGKIESLSVAAFVDLTPPEAAEGEESAPAITVKREDIEKILIKGLGVTKDELEVVETTFHRDKTAAAALLEGDEGDGGAFWLEIARRGSLGILVIGVLLALRIFRGKKASAKELAEQTQIEGQVAGSQNLLTGSAGGTNPDLLRTQITNALQENPQEVKRLFQRWVENE